MSSKRIFQCIPYLKQNPWNLLSIISHRKLLDTSIKFCHFRPQHTSFKLNVKNQLSKIKKSKTFPNQNFSRNFSIILLLIYKYFSPKGILCCSRAFPLLYKRILYVLTLTPPISSLHFSISSGDIILYTLKNMFYLFPIQYIFVFLSYFM